MAVTDKVLAHDIRQVIVQLYRQMQKQIGNEEQLSVAAQNVLYQLTQHDSMLPSELCSVLHVSSQYISQVFSQLERYDYITRKPSETDGRKILVSLTKQGRLKVYASREQREQWLEKLLAERLSKKEKELLSKSMSILGQLVNIESDNLQLL